MTVVHKKRKSNLPDVQASPMKSPFRSNAGGRQPSELSTSHIENIHLPDIPQDSMGRSLQSQNNTSFNKSKPKARNEATEAIDNFVK